MGQLVERRIGVVGKSSFMIVIPKGWLRYHGLQAGDTVEVVTNGTLIVRPLSKNVPGQDEEASEFEQG